MTMSRARRLDESVRRLTRSIDCRCDGVPPLCACCLVTLASQLARLHPASLSMAILKRRIPMLTGREADILLEAMRRLR